MEILSTQKEELGVEEEFGEPMRLIVVFDGYRTRVKEDEGDDKPKPPLLLAQPPYDDSGPSDAGSKLAVGAGQLLLLCLELPLPLSCYPSSLHYSLSVLLSRSLFG